MDFRKFLQIKLQVCFSDFWPKRWNLMPKNQIFYEFYKKKLLPRCSKLIWIAERKASHLKIMFYHHAQTLVVQLSRGTCARGDIVIRISFAFAQHISEWGSKNVIWIVHVFEGVVLELYESPTNSAYRVTSFFSMPLNATLFLSDLEKNNKIWCFRDAKTSAIISISGNNTKKKCGF